MHLRLISCDVFTREACYCIARSANAVSPVFTHKGEHNAPDGLRGLLQGYIDEAEHESPPFDAVLLLFGLCGNATAGLQSRSIPVVIPRAHDCTTLFLGSKHLFRQHFGDNPSQIWASVGYSERGSSIISDASTRQNLGISNDYADLVATYGEENAKYLLDALQIHRSSNKLMFLDVPETRVPHVIARIEQAAADESLALERLAGSLRLVEALLAGDWPEEDFLVVPPGHTISALYDMDQIVAAKAI